MANTIIAVSYQSSTGQEFQVGVNAEVAAQMAGTDPDAPKIGTGGGSATAGLPPLPSSVKPRRVYMKNPAGKGRYVIVTNTAAYLWTTNGATLNLEDSDGASTVYTKVANGERNERFGRSRS